MNKHLSLDIETFDNVPSAVVTQIGISQFSRTEDPRKVFECFLDVGDQVRKGRTVSSSTMAWWLKQDSKALDVQSAGLPVNLEDPAAYNYLALQGLVRFVTEIGGGKDTFLWGNGPAFDNAIVASLLASYSIKNPFWYRGDSCLRTLQNMYPGVGRLEYGKDIIPHCAASDALHQAREIQVLLDHHFVQTGLEYGQKPK